MCDIIKGNILDRPKQFSGRQIKRFFLAEAYGTKGFLLPASKRKEFYGYYKSLYPEHRSALYLKVTREHSLGSVGFHIALQARS